MTGGARTTESAALAPLGDAVCACAEGDCGVCSLVPTAEVDCVGAALNVVASAGCCSRCACCCCCFCSCDACIEVSSLHAVATIDNATTASIQCNRLGCGLRAVLCSAGIVILRHHA